MSDFKNGTYKIIYLFVNGDYYPIGCLTSNSFSETSEMLDTTTRQNANGWKTSIPTAQSYSLSFSGLITTGDKGGSILTYEDLKTIKRDRILVSWKTHLENPGYSEFGNGYITSLSNNAEIDSFIDFSAEMVGYGEPSTALDTEEQLNYTLNVTI